MKIILVEDNPADVRLIRESFKDNPYPENFEVTDFSKLTQFIQYLNSPNKNQIDAILLDLGLPDSLGIATLKKLRGHTNGIPIIVLTGLDDSALALQAMKEGAQDYLIKSQISGQLLIKSILYSVERKNIEKLIYQSKIVEETNRKKSEFLAMMSHEIRNPLGIIIGFSELMTNSKDDRQQKDFAKTILSNANHLNELINDILDLSRIEAGRIDLDNTLFDLREELRIICEGFKKQANQKGLELSFAFEEPVSQFIRSDRTRLRQVIYNLIGNAIKFTKKGGINLLVRDSQKHSLEILVQDTGCGIDKSEQLNLFQPFSQANKTIYRQHKGTGLGLVLSKQIAKCLGGDLILLDSIPSQGSTFLFSLDTGMAECEITPSPESERQPRSARPLLDSHILLIEDNFEMRELTKDILTFGGAKVTVGENGQQALEQLDTLVPNLVFMDIHMTQLDGYKAIKLIRERGHTFPVVALTGSGSAEERNRCLSSGFDDFLAKPFKNNALIDMAAKWSVKIEIC